MSTTPLVSVIVPAYNAERFLPDAVRSALQQTFKDLELIIVNDGSSDSTAALAEGYKAEDPRVRVVHKHNGGLSSARNSGVAAAHGELVCFLDADDMFLPDKLERQVAFLRLFPSCDVVYSDYYFGDAALNPVLFWCRSPPDVPMRELFSYSCWFAPMSPLVRAPVLDKVGPFDEALKSSEDWDFWIRASRCATFGYLPGPVAVYRTHPGQMHNDGAQMRRTQERVIQKHFQPGSIEWHNSNAAMAWSSAKRSRVAGDYARMAAELFKLAWHVRSMRTLKNIFNVAGL